MLTYRVILPILFFGILILATNAPADPKRIASLNLCTDELLLSLADPGQIVSLTWLAREESLSAFYEPARLYHQNNGRASDVIPLNPDVVFLSEFSPASTVDLLETFGIRTVVIPEPRETKQLLENIRAMSFAIDQVEKGEQLIAHFSSRLDSIIEHKNKGPISALLLSPGIASFGSSSVKIEILKLLNIRVLNQEKPSLANRYLSIEELARSSPDFLIIDKYSGEYPSVSEEMLRHPLIKSSFNTIEVEAKDWLCSTNKLMNNIENINSKIRDYRNRSQLNRELKANG